MKCLQRCMSNKSKLMRFLFRSLGGVIVCTFALSPAAKVCVADSRHSHAYTQPQLIDGKKWRVKGIASKLAHTVRLNELVFKRCATTHIAFNSLFRAFQKPSEIQNMSHSLQFSSESHRSHFNTTILVKTVICILF